MEKRKRKWKEKRKKSRYGVYYYTMMTPIWREHWEKDIKRLHKLKKQLKKLGPVSTNKKQIINTANMFVELINLLTNFVDNGLLQHAPKNKHQVTIELNETLTHYIAREEQLLCYLNKSQKGQSVTANNLCIGFFSNISENDDITSIKTKTVNGVTFQVLADFAPVIDWINQSAVTLSGNPTVLSQKAIASYITDIRDKILAEIDSVLI